MARHYNFTRENLLKIDLNQLVSYIFNDLFIFNRNENVFIVPNTFYIVF